jgi:phosphonate dehydrogenase
MSARRIVVTHRLHDEVAQRLRQAGTLVMNQSIEPWTEAELDDQLREADAWIAFMTDHVDARRLALANRLKVVAGALKGSDSFDAEACERAGVWLTVVPDLLTAPTAELALGLAIASARHVLTGHQRVRSGTYSGWRARDYGRGLEGSVCAVLGQGRLGSAIVDRLQGFACEAVLGVDPRACNPRAQAVTPMEALAQADFVFVALPLNGTTVHSIDATALAACSRAPILVNVGRGSVVVESDIAAALLEGRLGGYAADVFAFEDWLLPDRPLQVHPTLLAAPNTLFTPHLGSAVRAVLAVLSGQVPPGAVNTVGSMSRS